jgi:hypothetical protein
VAVNERARREWLGIWGCNCSLHEYLAGADVSRRNHAPGRAASGAGLRGSTSGPPEATRAVGIGRSRRPRARCKFGLSGARITCKFCKRAKWSPQLREPNKGPPRVQASWEVPQGTPDALNGPWRPVLGPVSRSSLEGPKGSTAAAESPFGRWWRVVLAFHGGMLAATASLAHRVAMAIPGLSAVARRRVYSALCGRQTGRLHA